MMRRETLALGPALFLSMFARSASAASPLNYSIIDPLLWKIYTLVPPRLALLQGHTAPFTQIGSQRYIPRYMSGAMMLGDPGKCEIGLAGLQELFHFYQKNGFPDGPSNNGLNDTFLLARLETMAFFLVELCRCYHISNVVPQARRYSRLLSEFVQVMRPGMMQLVENLDALIVSNIKAANRVSIVSEVAVFASIIYQEKVDLSTYVKASCSLITNQGWFLENGGYDFSYECANLLGLSLISFIRRIALVEQTLQKGTEWTVARVSASGQIDMGASTRTLGQDVKADGSPKGPNWNDITGCLLVCGAVLADDSIVSKGRAVWDVHARKPT